MIWNATNCKFVESEKEGQEMKKRVDALETTMCQTVKILQNHSEKIDKTQLGKLWILLAIQKSHHIVWNATNAKFVESEKEGQEMKKRVDALETTMCQTVKVLKNHSEKIDRTQLGAEHKWILQRPTFEASSEVTLLVNSREVASMLALQVFNRGELVN